jgi:glycosyltransferase involved in cell wall biosynthesis
MIKKNVKYSLVVTCYFEELSVDEFYSRSKAVLDAIGEPYEIIFINDGSTDATYEKLCEIFDADENVSHIIDFTRNYGQGAATTAGFERATGEYILYLDSDLQLDPEDIPKLIEMQKKGSVFVRGYRVNRKDPLYRKICSWLVNKISARSMKTKDFGASYMLIARSVVDQFEVNRWNLWTKANFFQHFNDIAEVPVNHHERRYGTSGQPLLRLWRFNIHVLINGGEMLFQYIAFAAATFASLLIIRVLVSFFSPAKILPIVTNGLILNAVIIGFFILLGTLCILGEFCARTYFNVQRQPRYVIREIRSRDD